MAVTPAIDITAGQRRAVLALLSRYLPNTTVWAYGSRVKWTSHPASDLDLVAFATASQVARVAELREAFDDSDLPFRVDLFVWDEVPSGFRKGIEAEHEVLAPANGSIEIHGWRKLPFSKAVILNPPVSLDRGKTYPFVDMASVRPGSRCVEATQRRKYSGGGTRFCAGDTLMARITPCLENGKIARYRGLDALESAYGSTEFIVVRGRPKVTDPEFAYYLTRWDGVRGYAIGQMMGTSGRQRVATESLNHLVVPVPPLPEQRAIAGILGALDDKIELNRRMAETLDEAVRALFRSWFVDFDPVRAKMEGRDACLPQDMAALFPNDLVESQMGEIPKGWSVRSLEEIARFQNGLALQKYPALEGEECLPILKIAQLRSEMLDDKKCASSDIPTDCIVEDGDVIFSWSGSLMVRVWCGGRAALNQHLFKVTSADFREWFTLSWLHLHMPEFQSIAADKATTMGHIKRRHLRDALCVVPSEQVLVAADSICASIHECYIDAKVESRKLGHLRDVLLPKLISGEIRTSDAENVLQTDV